MALTSYTSFVSNAKSGWGRMSPVGNGETAKTHYVDGEPHAVNGQPSRIYFSGKQEWHRNGELHNDSGPAVTYPPSKQHPNGHREYWLNGKQVDKAEHGQAMEKNNQEKEIHG